MKNNLPDIRYLFEPKKLAVVGASSQVGKIGHSIVKNIVESGYQGKIYPINPKGGEMLGLSIHKSLSEINDCEIDLVTLVIPAKHIFQAVKECAKIKAKFLSIISSGFSEVGNTKEEMEIVNFAHDHGMRILGPNIFGIYSAKASMNATFGPSNISKGHVSIITQSGALGIAMIGKTQVEKIGLSSIISIGNKSDIDEADLIEYLVEDPQTKVIFMYMEGIKRGERLIEVLQKATSKKPIVVIKSGRSKRGAMAAASHTGSLAGADQVFSDIMEQCGVHRATTITEALDWCKFLSTNTRPKGENCVIITNGGGVGVLAADACEQYGIHLFDDLKTLECAFLEKVPSFGSVKNPIDITGGASMQDYKRSIETAFEHPDIHSIICLGCETAVLTGETFKNTILEFHKKYAHHKPAVFSFVGGENIEKGIAYLRSEGVPIFSDIYQSISCLGKAYSDFRNIQTHSDHHSKEDKIYHIKLDKISSIIKKAQTDGRNFLLAHEGKDVMEAAGISMPKSKITKGPAEAISTAEEIGYPVVMKIVSPDILHKSDAGGIALDLQNQKEVIDAYEAIIHGCKNYNPQAKITGIEVMEMVPPGTETIVGGRYDPSFGPVIMFGLGGIYVEVIKDVSFRSITTDRNQISGMLKKIRSYPLLLGVRGEDKKDINAIIDVIIKTGMILKHCPQITDIELNPLVAYDEGDGVKAVDVRIMIQ